MYIALIKQFRTTRYIFRKIVVGVEIGKVTVLYRSKVFRYLIIFNIQYLYALIINL